METGPLRLHTGTPSEFRPATRLQDGYPPIALNDANANAAQRFPENGMYTTKYTLWSFVPKLLYEQFRRATSAYFLLVCILASIKAISPVDPITAWSGLIFILVVAAVREAYEDWLRLQADVRANNARYRVLTPHGEETRRSYQLRVGDVLRLHEGERVPMDVVLLTSARPQGDAYVETAQLDGESNLKRKVPALPGLSERDVCALQGEVRAEAPHADLYSVKAALHVRGNAVPVALDAEHVLLCGTTLRHTPWALALALYAGPETKLALNLKRPPSKFSALDRKLNKYIVFIFVFKLGLVFAMVLASYLFSTQPHARLLSQGAAPEPAWLIALRTAGTYFALMNYLIPLSLVVTLDIVRFAQARFVEWDAHLDGRATAKTSNLNDELAMVGYVLSDKTGTLTENDMRFARAAVLGQSYDLRALAALAATPAPTTPAEHRARDLVRALALNHACEVEPGSHDVQGVPKYAAPSPDDEALCRAAAQCGSVFEGRVTADVAALRGGVYEGRYEVLLEVPFTSQRARMSVVVRGPDARRVLLLKGSDAVVLPRLAATVPESERRDVRASLATFAAQGLRTLVVAQRELSDTLWRDWHARYATAAALVHGREDALAALYDELECELTLLGVTAIEDRLQRAVPQTVHTLRRAGIKIWMLTGDKLETAVAIAHAAQLLGSDTRVLTLNGAESGARAAQLLGDHIAAVHDRHGHAKCAYALALDGAALAHVLSNADAGDAFMQLAKHADTVVCARATPLQKAALTALVQAHTRQRVLAIGDGGNDVSMIQQAHLGVGIHGREGAQAARAADFALGEFAHLVRLLLVHGRYSLLRNTKVIYMSFYKNAALFLGLIWFSLFSGASGQPLYGDWAMTFYNLIFTALPVLYIGLFEKDLREVVLEQQPEAYRAQRTLRWWTLLRWLGTALYHSLVIFFVAYFALAEDTLLAAEARSAGLRVLGVLTMLIGFHIVLAKLALETTHFVVWAPVAYALSLLNFHLWQFLESVLFVNDQYAAYPVTLGTGPVWLAVLVALVFALAWDVTYAHVQRQVRPLAWQILQEKFASSGKRAQRRAVGKDDSRAQPLLAMPASSHDEHLTILADD